MSRNPSTRLSTCGCCDPDLPEFTVTNRPGQPVIAFHLATHSGFLRRMVTRLPRWVVPDGPLAGRRPLARLTTREPDDPAMAFLDAWATVAHVLAFYQERLANEGFLRTATERRSVLELARAIGYELNPGVAASTYLVFTLDESDGTPDETTIQAGTQVLSIPTREGELPQTFETLEDFRAKVWWNRLRPRLSRPQAVTPDATRLLLQGTDLNLSPGDRMLLVERRDDGEVAHVRRKRVREVRPDRERGHTEVVFEGAGASVTPVGGIAYTLADLGSPAGIPAPAGAGGDPGLAAGAAFSGEKADGLLASSLSETRLQAILKMTGWSAADLLDYARRKTRLAGPTRIQVFVLREKAGIFGHNAPHYRTLSEEARSAFHDWDRPDWEIWRDSVKDRGHYREADLYLERPIPEIVPGSWLLLERPGGHRVFRVREVREGSRTGFGMSGRVTGLELADETGRPLTDTATDKDPAFKVRTTTAYTVSEELELAPVPVTADLKRGDVHLALDGLVPGLRAGQAVAIHGEQADAPGVERDEIRILDRVTHQGGITTLKFTRGLAYSYRRETVTLNANVVEATHGETVADEVLGSGDGSRAFQRFKLAKPPLTFVSAATPRGARSTLTVRVNGVEWTQAPSLHPLGPGSRAYVVRIDDNGQAFVVFGDGRRGARLPTGQENVTATYRSGIGLDGQVGPGTLTLLKKRPFGVQAVTNPVAASGAADPERLEDARENAPLTVLTLDRIVSLQDFEDFARAFTGIGKAQAVPLWDGERELVHLTVAGADGREVPAGSTLHRDLREAIERARDPLREVVLAGFRLRLFEMAARVLRDPAHPWEALEQAIREALVAAFSFRARAFGQPVTAAEILDVIHGVAGVRAVDLDRLYLLDGNGRREGPLRAGVLPARTARPNPRAASREDRFLPGELLLINEFGITLTERTQP